MKRLSLGWVVVAGVIVIGFCAVLIGYFGYEGPRLEAASRISTEALSSAGAANLVSAIYLNGRLYDTILELLVFSVAVLGVRFYLLKRGKEENVATVPESHVVRISADLLFPLILIIGIYLTLFGHLSPGGGFSGGVVAGTAVLLCAVAIGANVVGRRFREDILERVEWTILTGILALAFIPPSIYGLPLVDILPRGEIGEMASGGSILVYNTLIGAKVFIGTWVIIHYFLQHRGEI